MSLHFDITGDNSNFLRKLEEARNGVRSTSKQIEESGTSIEQMFGRLAKGAAALGAGVTAKEIASNVVRIRGEFQQLEVAFNTMLGSKEKADALMQQLVKTAATTPFDLQSVTGGAKQLLAYGVSAESVNGTLVQLGDIAAGLSIPLGDLVYLYGTTMSQGRLYTQDLNQFTGRGIPMISELAKQFGVAESEVKKLVESGKVGFPEVQKVIESLTNEGGKFGGLMEAQSKTITGKISNIEDSISTMYNNIGKSSEGFINEALSGVSYLVENYEAIGRTILELATTYGAYKAVLMSVAAYQSFAVGVTYSAEIAELSKLIPLKQQSANGDVIAAVASGKLTQSKAAQVIALRAEIGAKIQSLQATEAQTKAEYASAMASYKNATQRMLLAKQNMAIAQSQMSIAIKSGAADEIVASKKNAQTASQELNNAAIAKNTAHKSLNIAATNRKSASEALNTLQTEKNSVAQTVNATSTNILTSAKTKLAAASKALGLSMLANPYVLAAAAVVGLGYGIYKLITYQTDAEKAQEKLNDTVREFNSQTATENAEIDRLFDKLRNTNKEASSYQKTKDEIIKKYGGYLDGLNQEVGKLNDVEAAYRAISAAARQAAVDRAITKATQEAQDDWADSRGSVIDKLKDSLTSGGKMTDGAAEAFIETINRELKETGRLSDETTKKIEKYNYTITHPETGEIIGSGNSVSWAIDALKKNDKALDDLYSQINSKFGINTNEYENLGKSDIDAYIKGFENALSDFKKSGNKQTVQLKTGWVSFGSEEELNLQLNKLRGVKDSFDKSNSVNSEQKSGTEWLSSYKKAYEDAEKAYSDFLKSKKVMYDADRDKELKRLKEDRDTAKSTYESKGGSTSSDTKQESDAEKLRKEQEKYALLLDKQSREQKRMEEDSANELEQLEIDRLKEGSEKVLRQRAFNHAKELEAIEREAQDKKAKAIEEGRAAHEANPDEKKKPFNAEDFIKSEPVKKQFASFDNVADEKTKTSKTQYNRGDDLSGLLNEYQDYTDKRLAIETKFNKDLAVLDEQRKQAVKNGDTQQVEQIDRAKAQATTNKGKELMSMDYDKLKESPEYIRAFENLKETSSETLNSLLSQLENAKGTAAKVLSPDQLREYTTTIQDVMDELDSRNPWQALVDRKKELAEAENELAEAKRNLDKVNAGGKVASGTKLNEKTGKTDTTYLTAEQALLKYNKAKDKTVKADAKLVKAEKESLEIVEKLADSFKDIGDSIGGTTGEIIGLMGDITSFTTLCMTGMSNVSKTASAQMQAVEKASVILGIISAAIQLMQKLNSILPTADSQYEQYAAKLEEINKLTDAINEYRIAALEAQHAEEGWFSEDNLKNLRNYKELHDEVTKSYNTKAAESQAVYQEKSGGGWVTNSWNWLLDNTYGRIYDVDFARKYKEGEAAAINNLRIETRERSKGFLGTGIGGKSQKTEDLVTWAKSNGFGELFNDKGLINKESANSILNQYGDKLVGQTKETIESLVKLREKYDEYIQQLHEYVSTLYEPLVDNFVDGIWDWLDSGKNALDSFKEYASDTFRDIVSDMMKTIALEKIFNNEDVWGKGESYQSKVSKAYEDYASGLINEAELNKRVSEITQKMLSNAEAQLPAIQGVGENILDTIYKATGIDLKKSDSESSSQDSTNGGFQTMSQDEGKEMNGRFTAFQISNEEIKNSNEEIKNSMLSMLVSMNLISVSTNTNGITLMEIKNIALMSNSHLEDIAKYTKELIGFKQTIANIETSAKAMAGK